LMGPRKPSVRRPPRTTANAVSATKGTPTGEGSTQHGRDDLHRRGS
jgi:hypothetical protein